MTYQPPYSHMSTAERAILRKQGLWVNHASGMNLAFVGPGERETWIKRFNEKYDISSSTLLSILASIRPVVARSLDDDDIRLLFEKIVEDPWIVGINGGGVTGIATGSRILVRRDPLVIGQPYVKVTSPDTHYGVDLIISDFGIEAFRTLIDNFEEPIEMPDLGQSIQTLQQELDNVELYLGDVNNLHGRIGHNQPPMNEENLLNALPLTEIRDGVAKVRIELAHDAAIDTADAGNLEKASTQIATFRTAFSTLARPMGEGVLKGIGSKIGGSIWDHRETIIMALSRIIQILGRWVLHLLS